jgi:hypothetical protein
MWIVVAAALAAHSGPGAPAPRVVSSLVKIRPGELPAGEKSARLSLARGECEGTQVLVPPPARKVKASIDALSGPRGARLPVRLYRVGYVEVRTPSNSEGATGLWPDPLIPVTDAYAEEARRALPADSTEERPLVLYAEVCAPADQKPGSYRGELTLRGGAAVPFEVEVQPFTLPATSSLPNSFGISLYSIARGHRLEPDSDGARALLSDYARALLAHRLSAYGMGMDPPPVTFDKKGRARVDFTHYDRELGPFLDGTALPSGARFTTTDVRDSKRARTEEQKVAYYRAFREHFAARKWDAQLFLYTRDEPKPADLPLVKAQTQTARRAGISALVTAPAGELDADILAPTLNCFFARSGPQTCANPQPLASVRRGLKENARVWWYQSCNSHGCKSGPLDDPDAERAYTGWASYQIDHPATSNRAMGALAFAAGIDGELYFDTVYAYNEGSPWECQEAFGGNGDGTLFYPGTPEKIGGQRHAPVESLRLKAIRDGLEDYEYLTLLARRGGEEGARELVRSLVRSGYQLEGDPRAWERVRQTLTSRLRGNESSEAEARLAPRDR